MRRWLIAAGSAAFLSSCAAQQVSSPVDRCLNQEQLRTSEQISICQHDVSIMSCPPSSGLLSLLNDHSRACQEKKAAAQQAVAEASATLESAQAKERDRERQRLDAILQNPSPALVAFEKKAAPLYRDMGIAAMASGCHLRSPIWVSTLNTGLQMAAGLALRDSSLSADERQAALLDGRRRQGAALTELDFAHKGCQALVGSPDLERLDEMQWRMTGGYH